MRAETATATHPTGLLRMAQRGSIEQTAHAGTMALFVDRTRSRTKNRVLVEYLRRHRIRAPLAGFYWSAGVYTSSRIPDGNAVLLTKHSFTA
ncbi:hypothetical protein GCM10023088_57370 [Actinomadura verrucosospora]